MQSKFKRVCVLVLDGFGVGELPDAASFGDQGANTLRSIMSGLRAPTLRQLGLLECGDFSSDLQSTSARFAKMREASVGKDTTTGHWEMMGLPLMKAFSYFPQGFPESLMNEFISLNQLTGYLANRTASGTQIIEELGAEHIRTLKPIVYTSADSVFQIAAHEEHFGLQRLYEVCERTRELLNKSPFVVGRVIARPFTGEDEKFYRTKNRRDYSIKPPGPTALTALKKRGLRVLGLGKIPSIFDHEGFTEEWAARDDFEGFQETRRALTELREPGLIFSNLNDLDTLYGHRRNVQGYRNQLEQIDENLESVTKLLGEDDLLVITSDHGNDPAFKGSDHTREYVPLILWSPKFTHQSINEARLRTRESFADLGQFLAENFEAALLGAGKSFLKELR
jgi:phosphopentomutase